MQGTNTTRLLCSQFSTNIVHPHVFQSEAATTLWWKSENTRGWNSNFVYVYFNRGFLQKGLTQSHRDLRVKMQDSQMQGSYIGELRLFVMAATATLVIYLKENVSFNPTTYFPELSDDLKNIPTAVEGAICTRIRAGSRWWWWSLFRRFNHHCLYKTRGCNTSSEHRYFFRADWRLEWFNIGAWTLGRG